MNNFIDIASGISYRNLSTEQKNPFSPRLVADNNIKSMFSSVFIKSKIGFQAEIGGRYNDHSTYGSNFTYTINPSYLIADRYKVYANLSSAYRVPSLYQLFSQYGNLALSPETSRTYEAGFDLNFTSQINLSLSYFKRDIENVIDFGQVSAGKFGYLNQNMQNDKGYEVELSYKPTGLLNLNAYYAYVNGEVTTPVGTSFNLFRRPKNSFGLNAGLDVSKSLSFNLIYKFTGDRRDRYFDGKTFKTVEAELGSFNLLDVYTQYKVSTRLSLFTDIKNVLDQDYVEFAGYQTKGINFNAGFKLDIR
jgi:vitamin B12 transporter